MSSLIDKAYSAENFREKAHKLVDQLADYLSVIQQDSKSSVFKRFDPDLLFEEYRTRIEKQGESFANVTESVLADSIHLHHPNFMGHQVSPVLPETALSELLSAIMNNGVGVYEMGSPTVAMERVVIKQLAKQLGFDKEADGFLTSGGTLGNLTALLAARQIMTETDVWEQGTGKKQYAFMVSEQAHYCIDRAVRIMGWGNDGIVEVPVDDQFKMDPSQLEQKFQEAKDRGIQILGVVGSACSTATGAFDPLDEIAAFCQKKKLWFHVDAAHGGGAAYSSKYKHLLKGIEQADSVIVDFHKMLMAPALVTGVLFKKGDHSYQTFAQRAKYLWDQEDKEWYNLGKRTFECTKDMMALKVYLVLQEYGTELWEEIVNRLFGLGTSFAKLISERDGFELATNPQCNIVCFRHIPKDDRDLNIHNRRLRETLINEGKFFIVQTELNGKVYLRTTLMNVKSAREHLSALLNRLEELSQNI
ncbi:MAG: aminotransferase class I/II-fold pyridoxal phosphate-dependent enzyme [Balneolaceae bacterium]|nr:aminotransferase class I/II-fold pyridoxal phosphate-dependent enzyme [Balneolaceae bacterium]